MSLTLEQITQADKKNPEIEGTVTLDGAKIYRDMTEDEYGNVSGEVIIERPSNGYATDVALKIGESLIFDKNGKVYELYHRGNLKNLFDEGTEVTDPERNAALTNLGITKTVKTESLDVGGAEISVEKDDEGCVVIHRPMSQGYVPDSTLKMGYDFLTFNGNTVYHSGNLKDLTLPGNELDDLSKDVFMTNTGLDEVLGDVEAVLDTIIALQKSYIGGEIE